MRLVWVAIRISVFLASWTIIHFFILPVISILILQFVPKGSENIIYRLISTVSDEAHQSKNYRKLLNLRRHFRSELYCLFAFPMGVYLLSRYYQTWPHNLLHQWNMEVSFAFEVAAAYWMFSFYEDIACNEETIAHMKLLPGEKMVVVRDGYMFGLYGHHMVALIAYFWALVTQQLSGLCVLGLLFEGPVLLMNLRDVTAAFEKDLNYPYQHLRRQHVVIYNYAMLIIFHCCRTLSCLTWPLSLILWLRAIGHLPTASQVILHYLGACFSYVNTVLLVKYLYRYYVEDLMRVGAITKKEFWYLMKVNESKILAAEDEENVGSNESGEDNEEICSNPAGCYTTRNGANAVDPGDAKDGSLSDVYVGELEMNVCSTDATIDQKNASDGEDWRDAETKVLIAAPDESPNHDFTVEGSINYNSGGKILGKHNDYSLIPNGTI